jgi:thiamine biosynthesis lipoprotein
VHPPGAPLLLERQVALMGTIASLSTWDVDRTPALARLERFVRSLESTEAELSTWRSGTPIARINRAPLNVPFAIENVDLCRTLADVVDWQRATAGSFDPAVGPLIDVWDLRGVGRVPSEADLEAARARSGLRHVTFDRDTCSIVRTADTWIDSGAFGKGEALDRLRRLERQDAAWLVDLGGQIAVSGSPPGEAAWQVPVARPDARDRPLFTLAMTGGSVSVTAGSERDLRVHGKRIGHVLDPRSGVPAAFAGETIVWHERALAADVLSTALYVMGEEEGLAFAEANGLAACFVSAASGTPRIRTSAAFARRFGEISAGTAVRYFFLNSPQVSIDLP